MLGCKLIYCHVWERAPHFYFCTANILKNILYIVRLRLSGVWEWQVGAGVAPRLLPRPVPPGGQPRVLLQDVQPQNALQGCELKANIRHAVLEHKELFYCDGTKPGDDLFRQNFNLLSVATSLWNDQKTVFCDLFFVIFILLLLCFLFFVFFTTTLAAYEAAKGHH